MNYLIAFYFKRKKYDSKLNNVPAQMHRQESKRSIKLTYLGSAK